MPVASTRVPEPIRSVPRIWADGCAEGIFTRSPTLVGSTDCKSLIDAFIGWGIRAAAWLRRAQSPDRNGASQSRKPMPTQEVARAARSSALLQCEGRRHQPVLLDGGAADSWLHGDVLYADAPRATLTIHPSGWARWTDGSD